MLPGSALYSGAKMTAAVSCGVGEAARSLREGDICPLTPSKAPASAMGLLESVLLNCKRKLKKPRVGLSSSTWGIGYSGTSTCSTSLPDQSLPLLPSPPAQNHLLHTLPMSLRCLVHTFLPAAARAPSDGAVQASLPVLLTPQVLQICLLAHLQQQHCNLMGLNPKVF